MGDTKKFDLGIIHQFLEQGIESFHSLCSSRGCMARDAHATLLPHARFHSLRQGEVDCVRGRSLMWVASQNT